MKSKFYIRCSVTSGIDQVLEPESTMRPSLSLVRYLVSGPIEFFYSSRTRIFPRMTITSTSRSLYLQPVSKNLKITCFLGLLSRSDDDELDKYLFTIFDLQQKQEISKDSILTMLRHFPAIGFCNYQNVNIPDEFYDNIKESVIRCI